MQVANKQIESTLANLEVSNLNGGITVELPMVYFRPSLPLSTDTTATQEDVNHWPHLKGIELQSITEKSVYW